MKHLLNQSAVIQRKVRTFDNKGGWLESWTPMGIAQCRARPATGVERANAAQAQGRVSHVLYFLYGVDIRFGDRAVFTNGLALDIGTVANPGGLNRHLEVEATEIQREG